MSSSTATSSNRAELGCQPLVEHDGHRHTELCGSLERGRRCPYNVHMLVRLSWDPKKDRENQRKHGVSFQEAASIFHHVPLEVFHDPDHSDDEERLIAAGFSDRARVLLVVHCENHTGTEIRIISARKATRKERATLFGGAWQ
jgi:uncharacterized DUF497 family protein